MVVTLTVSSGTPPSMDQLNWATSNPAVATINSRGVVIAQADGRVSITATYATHSATVPLSVRTGGGTLRGTVTESVPTETRPVPGARLVVVDGDYADASAVTDANGSFTLADVDGALNLRVMHPEFENASLIADIAAGPTTIGLTPVFRMVHDLVEWRSPTWPSTERAVNGRLTFAMHHPGTVRITGQAFLYYSDAAPTCAELSDGRQVLFSHRAPWQSGSSATLTLPAGLYEWKIFDCSGTRLGPTLVSYRLTATHPS